MWLGLTRLYYKKLTLLVRLLRGIMNGCDFGWIKSYSPLRPVVPLSIPFIWFIMKCCSWGFSSIKLLNRHFYTQLDLNKGISRYKLGDFVSTKLIQSLIIGVVKGPTSSKVLSWPVFNKHFQPCQDMFTIYLCSKFSHACIMLYYLAIL